MEQIPFTIWVDADACPIVIREILYRAAIRERTTLVLVANQFIQTPRSDHIRKIQVAQGFDVADDTIIERISPGDLLITSDIPLAAGAIDKQAFVLSPRGEQFTRSNIRSRLNMRDFMDTMRASGIHSGGPPPLGQRDRQTFANHLDKILTSRRP